MLCALASLNASGLRARCHGDPSQTHHWEQLLAELTLKFFIDILYNGIEQYARALVSLDLFLLRGRVFYLHIHLCITFVPDA